MQCKDRQGNSLCQNNGQDKLLQQLYQTVWGRACLKVLICPSFSRLGGWFLNQSFSKAAIKPFVKANHIHLEEYEKTEFDSYNDFFIRRIKADKRPIDRQETHLIAPCDSKLSVYPITKDAKFMIKNTAYTLQSLTHSRKLAEYFQEGQLLLFRLTVDDYHRFCYIDDGYKSKNHVIPGVFHTVNPVANDEFPIYKENTREISVLKSVHFGTVLMIEVGALLVGKIVNNHETKEVMRGEEKGRFEFGGSTVIICLRKEKAILDDDIIENSKNEIETKVKMGEKIGVSV